MNWVIMVMIVSFKGCMVILGLNEVGCIYGNLIFNIVGDDNIGYFVLRIDILILS